MRADLKGAFATFAKDVDYDEMADAVYSGDYRRVFQTLPMDTLREYRLLNRLWETGEAKWKMW